MTFVILACDTGYQTQILIGKRPAVNKYLQITDTLLLPS